MTAAVAIVTDSTAYLPEDVISTHGGTVVPLQVVVGTDVREESRGRTASETAREWRAVTTSRPSPERFGQAYKEAAGAGATAVASVRPRAGPPRRAPAPPAPGPPRPPAATVGVAAAEGLPEAAAVLGGEILLRGPAGGQRQYVVAVEARPGVRVPRVGEARPVADHLVGESSLGGRELGAELRVVEEVLQFGGVERPGGEARRRPVTGPGRLLVGELVRVGGRALAEQPGGLQCRTRPGGVGPD